MENIHTPTPKAGSFKQSKLEKLALKFVPNFIKRLIIRNLINDGFYVSDKAKATVAGCVVMWYMDNDVRQFVMVQGDDRTEKARFVSFLDLDAPKTVHEMMQTEVEKQLGDVFYKSFDQKLIASDTVVAAPTFYGTDDVTGYQVPLQTVVWAVQITPEQAEMINAEQQGLELSIISEYGILGPDVEPTHKVVYQTMLRSIQSRGLHKTNMGNEDRLQQLLDAVQTSSRILH